MNPTLQQSQNGTDCSNKVIPEGIEIPITSFKVIEEEVKFSFPRDSRPLQPLVAAEATKEGILKSVSAIAFIDTSVKDISDSHFKVIQDFSYTNDKTPFLNFYICYDAKLTPERTFKVIRVNFDVDWSKYTPNKAHRPNKTAPKPSDIKFITSFLWDEDPEGSRGTETTVKESVG
ncbi:hypothetical protein F7018_10910 [Tenacibaculum aiptasiae]|uniref:Uncharacterized protein n=1 Tax=Tenacibaculum aiptasiae TaxID=426481 RepID=A0A7J5AII5_9FLAO|nr:hypothetical protein [Tenacibaculum aiptasiae]KAB1157427.1 hypothetical protein F7018_10910 [Tenacibaculum aiptasiae]